VWKTRAARRGPHDISASGRGRPSSSTPAGRGRATRSAPAASRTEDEIFARKTLDELNAERPLADAFFDYDQVAGS
jgi:hypothetical protein